ncbi:MAG: YIP1 family protein [Chloroflexi bacterium]|nr:YIP1 family protein [Chloroflexota bacterium]
MSIGSTAPARTIPAVAAPPIPRRRAGARPRQRAGERWRVAARRTAWYTTKWFRQMLNVLAHPEDAFWELKRTGDWLAVPFLLALAILSRMGVMSFMGFHYVFQGVETTKWNFESLMENFTRTFSLGMTQFIYGGNPEDTSLIQEGIRILVPFATWCLAHYAIAMIFYGEGGIKDIAVSAAFSLTPFILFAWPASLILTNITTLTEKSMYFNISWIVRIWIIYLFWTHIRVIHDFTAKRTLGTYVISLLGVTIIWALLALVYALTSNTYEFFYELFYELTTR